jgi:SAM-dependent methyltransferase
MGMVRQYFLKQAKSYQNKSTAFPWSWIRNRESAAIFKLMGDIAGDRVMDLGCGSGFYTRLLLGQFVAKVVAVDASYSMVEHLPEDTRVAPVVADAAWIPIKCPLDKIICAGLLEFVDDPPQVLSNINSQSFLPLDLYLLVPFQNIFGKCYRVFHQSHGLSIRLFTCDDMKHLADETGWRVIAKREVFPFTLIMHWKRKE